MQHDIEEKTLEWYSRYSEIFRSGIKSWVESLKYKYGVITKNILEKEVDDIVNSTMLRRILENSGLSYSFEEFIVDFAEYLVRKYLQIELASLRLEMRFIFRNRQFSYIVEYGVEKMLASDIMYGFFQEFFADYLSVPIVLGIFDSIYKKYAIYGGYEE